MLKGKARDLEVSGVWIPTRKQVIFLREAARAGYGRTLGVVAEAAGVHPHSVERWLSTEPGFRAAYHELWRSMVADYVTPTVAALAEKAIQGGDLAIRTLLEMGGAYRPAVDHHLRVGDLIRQSMKEGEGDQDGEGEGLPFDVEASCRERETLDQMSDRERAARRDRLDLQRQRTFRSTLPRRRVAAVASLMEAMDQASYVRPEAGHDVPRLDSSIPIEEASGDEYDEAADAELEALDPATLDQDVSTYRVTPPKLRYQK